MGNECYARYNIAGTFESNVELQSREPESIALNEIQLLERNSSPGTVTSSSVQTINQERKQQIVVPAPPPVGLARSGRPLQGLPVIEPTIKQAWSNLKMFTYSYDSFTDYRSPFRFDDTGEIYFGQWKNGVPEGRGFIYSPDKYLYEGSWKKGAKDGRARVVFLGGNLLEGQFNQGRLDGQITYTSPNFYFRGILQSGLLHGKVKQTTQTYIFKGQYQRGKRHKGELQWNGNSYVGKFDDEGNFHKEGALKTDIGTYTGEFYHGVKQGEGEFVWKDGLKYKGRYEKGLKEGFGALYLADGTISYEGSWKNNLPHGRGRTYIQGQPQNQVEWIEGIQKEDIQQWSKPLVKPS